MIKKAKGIAFPVSLALTLTGTGGAGAAPAYAGWLLLGILLWADSRVIIPALYFYSAFFHSAGFFPGLFFTLKHFHIAFFLFALIILLQGKLLHFTKRGLCNVKPLYPVFIIFPLAVLAGAFYGTLPETVRFAGNWGLVLLSFTIVSPFLFDKDGESREGAVRFLVLGTAVQMAAAGYHDAAGSPVFGTSLIENKLLAMQAGLVFFLSAYLILTAHRRSARIYSFVLFILIFTAVIMTRGRSVWIAIACSSGLFAGMLRAGQGLDSCTKRTLFKKIFIFTGLSITLFIASMFFFPENYYRFLDTLDVLNPADWRWAFADRQNFGFFGHMRRDELLFIKDHFWQMAAWGTGYGRQVTDIHGLFFMLFAASGFPGLLFFIASARAIAKRLYAAALKAAAPSQTLLALSLLSSLAVWIISSLTQTFVLQFCVWAVVFLAVSFQPLKAFHEN